MRNAIKRKSIFTILAVGVACLCVGLFSIKSAPVANADEVISATTVSTVTMAEGAQARYGEYSGARFTAYVNESFYNGLGNGASAGVLFKLYDGDDTLIDQDDSGVSEQKIAGWASDAWTEDEKIDGIKCFNSVIYNIPENAYGQKIIARGFVKNAAGEYTLSTNQTVRSIAQIATNTLVKDYSSLNESQTNELKAYVNGVTKNITTQNGSGIAVDLASGKNLALPTVAAAATYADYLDYEWVASKAGEQDIVLGNANDTVYDASALSGEYTLKLIGALKYDATETFTLYQDSIIVVDLSTYNMRFAVSGNNGIDDFYSKASKDASGITFDFLSKEDFAGAEFVNIYLDLPSFNTGYNNWRLNSEDANARVYSDGSVYLFTEFNGSNDNTWFKMDYTNYANGISGKFAKGEKLSNVTISRVGGITQFSVVLPYDKLGITADDEIRFYLKECADNGNDYALYAGNLTVNGVDMGDPVWANNWAIMLADGTVRYLGENAISFSNYISSKIEKFEANVSASNGVVTFDFLTYGVFGESGTTEFINLFLDMPALNTSTTNWTFKTEDVNIRIYSDGSVYLMTEFNGSADNLWWKMDFTNYSNGIYRNGQKVISSATKLEDVTISRENNKTQFSLSVSLERLGNASASSFRVYMEECCENGGNDYGMYADGYMAYKGRAVTGNHLCQNWPTFTVATNAITF